LRERSILQRDIHPNAIKGVLAALTIDMGVSLLLPGMSRTQHRCSTSLQNAREMNVVNERFTLINHIALPVRNRSTSFLLFPRWV